VLQNPGGATDKPQLLGGRYRRDKLHSRRSDKLIIGLRPSSDTAPLYHR